MDLQSLGHAAATYQRDPRVIESALHAVQADLAAAVGAPIPREAQPALTLNGLPYFHTNHIAAAIAWLVERETREAKEGTKNAN